MAVLRYLPGVFLLLFVALWVLVKVLWLLVLAVFWTGIIAVVLVFLWIINKMAS